MRFRDFLKSLLPLANSECLYAECRYAECRGAITKSAMDWPLADVASQGTLTEVENSVQVTSLGSAHFNIIYLDLNEEANCTDEPSPSVSVP